MTKAGVPLDMATTVELRVPQEDPKPFRPPLQDWENRPVD